MAAARGLAAVLVPVLRHRLRLRPEALPGDGPHAEALATEDFLRDLARSAAPDASAEAFAAALDAIQGKVRL